MMHLLSQSTQPVSPFLNPATITAITAFVTAVVGGVIAIIAAVRGQTTKAMAEDNASQLKVVNPSRLGSKLK